MSVAQLDRVPASEAGSRRFNSCRTRHFLVFQIMTFLVSLPRPFTALAPMEDITDTVFRQVVIRCGRPNLFFTEFVSVEGLFSAGYDAVSHRLNYSPVEKPIIAQIWGKTPEKFFQAAKYIRELGFDGVDINMGCSVPKVIKSGCCSALINNKPLAKEIFCATKEGAGDLPVSIKTRIGFLERKTEEWGDFLLDLQPDLLTIHGRTAKEQFRYSADWEEIAKVVELRNAKQSKTLIIGNGDVVNYSDIQHKAVCYGVDGVMLGRGILSNIYAFNSNVDSNFFITQKRIELLLYHLRLFNTVWGEKKNYSNIKKYVRTYISNMEGAPTLRNLLMQTNSLMEAETVLKKWCNEHCIKYS